MDKRKRADIYERIERERARRLGGAASTKGLEQPQFLTAAKDEAQKQFKSARAVLREDSARLAKGRFPTVECVLPYELDLVAQKGSKCLGEERLRHVHECRFCLTILSLAQPNDTRLREFLQRAAAMAELVGG